MPTPRYLSLAEAHAVRQAGVRAAPNGSTRLSDLLSLIGLLESDGVERHEILSTAGLDPILLAQMQSDSAPKPTPLLDQFGEPHQFQTSTNDASPVTSKSNIDSLSTSFINATSVQSQRITATQSGTRGFEPSGKHVVLLIGDQDGRRLDLEAAEVRDVIPRATWNFRAEPAANLGNVRDLLDMTRPSILHINAHADYEGLHLVANGQRSIVAWIDLVSEIQKSVQRPDLVVLNACRSFQHAQLFLDIGVSFVVSVDGIVEVDCARQYAVRMYREFASFDLHRSKENADSSIRSTWPSVRYDLLSARGSGPWFAPWCIAPRPSAPRTTVR